jgi:hypothetical protein
VVLQDFVGTLAGYCHRIFVHALGRKVYSKDNFTFKKDRSTWNKLQDEEFLFILFIHVASKAHLA